MKKILGLVGLVGMASMLVACGSPSVSYTISGEYMAIETPVPEELEAAVESIDTEDAGEGDDVGQEAAAQSEELEVAESETDEASQSEEPAVESMDLSTATVVVSYEMTNSDGVSEVVELHSGAFADGKVEFTGTVKEPTDVTISVDAGDGESLQLTALVGTGSDITFALQDVEGPNDRYATDRLVLVGSADMSRDERKRFKITGDLSNVEEDLSNVAVKVYRRGYDENGGSETIEYVKGVLLVDGKFSVEADEETATIAYLMFDADGFYSSASAIIEPGAEITISALDASGDRLQAQAGSGRHAKLVESWANSDEYLALEAQYTQALDDYIAQMEAERAEEQAADVAGEDVEETELEASDESESSESEEEIEILALKDGIAQAEGCEHVVLDDVLPGIMDGPSASYEPPAYMEFADKMSAIRSEALLAIVNDEQADPIDILLAVELGVFRGDDQESTESNELRVYDELAQVMDEDLVASRITPARDAVAQRIAVREADSGLVPGQKAPEFALPDLDGTEIALVDVITDNELVLIDFWASWCGPCIASFPHLKKLYSAYNEDGFEIVAVSIDSTQEEWVDGSDENELPWINLGEIGGWDGTVANSYGVQFIPKGYLVDMKGCIVQKDLKHPELKEVLVAKFGEKPEEEPEVETEAAPIDPGADDVGG